MAEKPASQALERAQDWLRLPNGEALRGFSHEYKRHGTTTLFAALVLPPPGKDRQEFLDFMNRIVPRYPDQELHPSGLERKDHAILDNLNTHKPKHDRWRSRHPNIHFHYTPTHAAWLNQLEVWFSLLTRQALQQLSATSVRDVCGAIDAFTDVRNQHPMPFEWTKAEVHPGSLTLTYAGRY